MRNRRAAGALAVLVAAGAVVAIVVVTEAPGSSKGASQPPASAGAATVQRRDLVQTDTESGTLGYARPQTVYNRLSGTITWLPTVGQQIAPGQTLFKVDNQPVVLLNGTTPAYRALSPSVSAGPDVQELNQNLVNLGFDPTRAIAIDDTWQAATTAAVERWQASLGETETGTIGLGQIVFLPGSQIVSTVSTVVGSTGGGGGGSGSGGSGSSGASGASLETGAPRPEFVSLNTTPTTTASPPSPTTTSTGQTRQGKKHKTRASSPSNSELLALIKLLQAEIAEMRSSRSSSAGSGSPSASASRSSSSGGSNKSGSSSSGGAGSSSSAGGAGSSGGGTATAVLQTTSTSKVVTVQLDATKQSEAVQGEPVTVELPDGTAVNGKISQVSPVAQSSSSSSSGSGSGGGGNSSSPSATIPVTITLTGHRRINGLDQAAVSVNFVQQRANNVLSVPVTALIATQGGNYAVQEAAAPHSLIPVTPGLFAAGYVQISGPGIYEGLQVTDSQG